MSYFLWRFSLETVSFLRPRALRALITLRPDAVLILSRNPCLFLLFLTEGWNVLNGIRYYNLGGQKYAFQFSKTSYFFDFRGKKKSAEALFFRLMRFRNV